MQQIASEDYRERLKRTFPWLPEDFGLTHNRSGIEDTDDLCRRIEKAYKEHITSTPESVAYLRQSLFKAITYLRNFTKSGWLGDCDPSPLMTTDDSRQHAFPV